MIVVNHFKSNSIFFKAHLPPDVHPHGGVGQHWVGIAVGCFGAAAMAAPSAAAHSAPV